MPKHEKIEFAHGESEKIVPIFLVNERLPHNDGKDMSKEVDLVDAVDKKIDHDDDSEEVDGPKFKVVLEKPDPESVKISKKNCCTVELQTV